MGSVNRHQLYSHDLDWVGSIRDECQEAGVAFFFKQAGSNPFTLEAGAIGRIRDPKGGDPAEWPEDLRVREFPK